MKERPILFAGEMVRAIIDGRKTQTRRLVKPQPDFCGGAGEEADLSKWGWHGFSRRVRFLPVSESRPPLGTVGDQLWVRETWRMDAYNIAAEYRASTSALMEHIAPWKPSIHMPRWASRIDLEITAVRVERVQDITEEDAKAEGVNWKSHVVDEASGNLEPYEDASDAFKRLWQSIYANWDTNPWVWVYEFRMIKP